MIRFLAGRLLGTIPTLIVVSIVMFLVLHLAPGDPVQLLLGEDATPEAAAALRAMLGLDRPLPVQYVDWLWALVRGDLGHSIRTHESVAGAIFSRLPVTFELTVLALCVSLAIGLPLGIIAALRRNSAYDVAATFVALVGVSLPTFVVGLGFILVAALWWRILPPSGFTPLLQNPVENMRHMFMPALALGAALAGIITRMTRSSLLETLGADYVRTARAKGLAPPAVLVRHTLRNALIPVVTIVGLEVGALLGGAILTETVFALPGVGRLVIESIFARDFPMVQGAVVFLALARVATNFAVDVSYGWLDPRITYA